MDLSVNIGKTVIKKTNSYKYLGIIVDINLKWSEHIEAVQKKLQKTLGVLYKTRKIFNKKYFFINL